MCVVVYKRDCVKCCNSESVGVSERVGASDGDKESEASRLFSLFVLRELLLCCYPGFLFETSK